MRGHPVIRGHSDERTPCNQGTLRWEDTLWSGDTPMRGHPVIRGHSYERTPCDQGTLLWEDTLWSGDTPMRGHPVIRGHSYERTPCDQGTLLWEDTLWSGDIFSEWCITTSCKRLALGYKHMVTEVFLEDCTSQRICDLAICDLVVI